MKLNNLKRILLEKKNLVPVDSKYFLKLLLIMSFLQNILVLGRDCECGERRIRNAEGRQVDRASCHSQIRYHQKVDFSCYR